MIVVKGNKYLVTQIGAPDVWREAVCNYSGQQENGASSFIIEGTEFIAIVPAADLDKRVKEI